MENPPETPKPAPDPRPAARPAAPPSGPIRIDPLNLARRPFLNSRPVVRVSLILWMLGLLLLLVNVTLFWSYLSSSEDKRAEIARGVEEIDRRQAEVQELESRLDSIDLTKQNEEILFLNSKIRERTFSFNQLLDHLAKVLPNDVRLNRLDPELGEPVRGARGIRARRATVPDGQVALVITGETRDIEALDRFVQNLFVPPFANPNLARYEQSEDGSNIVRFEVTVQYVPGEQSQNVVIEEVPVIEEAPPGSAPPSPVPGAPGGQR